MKLDTDARFPYPVLSSETDDYLSGLFSIELEVEEIPSTSHVTLDYKITLTEPTLGNAVAEGKANIGLFVTCLDTYFNRLFTVGTAASQISFDPGTLLGKVTIKPMIWASKKMEMFSLANCHPEFGGKFITIPAGAILALDQAFVLNVGREKLAQMETIFSLVEDPDLSENHLSLQLESERIQILISKNIFQPLNKLREISAGKAILLNSVYLPAVMEVINILKDNSSTYEGRRWHSVFLAKCQHIGIDLDNAEPWRDAQKLLAMPFSEISRIAETIGFGD